MQQQQLQQAPYDGQQSSLSGSLQRLGIQDPNYTPATQQPRMPPYSEGPYGESQSPHPVQYDDSRQDSLRESQPYSSRQNSMRDMGPGPPYVGDNGVPHDIGGGAPPYDDRQDSMRDSNRPYEDRQDSIRDGNQPYGGDESMGPPYGSQSRIPPPFDISEPPLAQGSQDHLAAPFNPAGSQSRLNRSGELQGSQLRLGSEPAGSRLGSEPAGSQIHLAPPYGQFDNGGYDDENAPPPRQESIRMAGAPPQPPGFDLDLLRRSPSVNSQNRAFGGLHASIFFYEMLL